MRSQGTEKMREKIGNNFAETSAKSSEGNGAGIEKRAQEIFFYKIILRFGEGRGISQPF